MSIIVKGEPMPEACAFCPCFRDDSIDGVHAYQCKATFITYGKEDDWIWNTRPNWCPLVELPEKHGRLIDADATMKRWGLDKATKYGNETAEQQHYSYSTMMMYEIVDILDDAPVVIEAEGEG